MISIWKESESGQILLEESESGSKLIQFENPQRIIGWVSFLQHLPSKRNLLSATFTERSNSTAACSKRYVHYNIYILIRSVVLCLDNHKGITRPNTITFLSVLLKNGLFYVITWKLLRPFFCDFPDNDTGENFVRSERFFVVKALLGREWDYLSKTKSFWQFVTNNSHFPRTIVTFRSFVRDNILKVLVNW